MRSPDGVARHLHIKAYKGHTFPRAIKPKRQMLSDIPTFYRYFLENGMYRLVLQLMRSAERHTLGILLQRVLFENTIEVLKHLEVTPQQLQNNSFLGEVPNRQPYIMITYSVGWPVSRVIVNTASTVSRLSS